MQIKKNFFFYFSDGCAFYFDSKTYAWGFRDTKCGIFEAKYIDYYCSLIVVLSTVIIDLFTLIGLRKFRKVSHYALRIFNYLIAINSKKKFFYLCKILSKNVKIQVKIKTLTFSSLNFTRFQKFPDFFLRHFYFEIKFIQYKLFDINLYSFICWHIF